MSVRRSISSSLRFCVILYTIPFHDFGLSFCILKFLTLASSSHFLPHLIIIRFEPWPAFENDNDVFLFPFCRTVHLNALDNHPATEHDLHLIADLHIANARRADRVAIVEVIPPCYHYFHRLLLWCRLSINIEVWHECFRQKLRIIALLHHEVSHSLFLNLLCQLSSWAFLFMIEQGDLSALDSWIFSQRWTFLHLLSNVRIGRSYVCGGGLCLPSWRCVAEQMGEWTFKTRIFLFQRTFRTTRCFSFHFLLLIDLSDAYYFLRVAYVIISDSSSASRELRRVQDSLTAWVSICRWETH